MEEKKTKKPLRPAMAAFLLACLFLAGLGAGYVVFKKNFSLPPAPPPPAAEEEFTYLRVYYPLSGRLQMEERRVPRAMAVGNMAEATVREFLKGPSGVSVQTAPQGAELLGAYSGSDGILYVDLSEGFRRGFRGDALSEFLLLRGLYESLLSNVYGTSDVRVLVEGREAESIGGHISLLGPLGETVSQGMEQGNGK